MAPSRLTFQGSEVAVQHVVSERRESFELSSQEPIATQVIDSVFERDYERHMRGKVHRHNLKDSLVNTGINSFRRLRLHLLSISSCQVSEITSRLGLIA